MESSPTLDLSNPDPLRVAGFLTTVFGALVAGVGATLTWVTVGIEAAAEVDSVTKGVDVWDGRVVLGCAVAMLVAVLVTRMAGSPMVRRSAAAAVIVAGIVCLVVGGAFLGMASSRFDPVDDERLASAIADATGVPIDQVTATLGDVVDELGAHTELGVGPYLAIVGGLAGAIGGVLVLTWTTRQEPEPDEGDDV
jgi:hypothetical protein